MLRSLETPTWPNRELSCWVVAGGIRWHVQRCGHGPGLLLVHGAGASTHSWRDVLPILATDYSVLAADLPGHAFTDAVRASQSSLDGMSGLFAELLHTLEFSPTFCVGHSAGAALLCRMALDGHIAPKLIVSLNGALMPFDGAAALFSPIARLLAASSMVSRLIAWHARDPARVARVIRSTGSTLDARGVDLYARLVSDPAHIEGVLRMMANWDLTALEHELPRLKVALALFCADNDRAVPAQQALAVKRIVPQAIVYHLPALGHLAHEERPALLAREIARVCA